MNKQELREQMENIHLNKITDKQANELITLIHNATLDKVKEKIVPLGRELDPLGRELDSNDEFDQGYIACRVDVLSIIYESIGIDNLRGK